MGGTRAQAQVLMEARLVELLVAITAINNFEQTCKRTDLSQLQKDKCANSAVAIKALLENNHTKSKTLLLQASQVGGFQAPVQAESTPAPSSNPVEEQVKNTMNMLDPSASAPAPSPSPTPSAAPGCISSYGTQYCPREWLPDGSNYCQGGYFGEGGIYYCPTP